MKFIFVVIYFVVETFAAPCPDPNYSGAFACAVYHGTVTDTTKIEVITTDATRVQKILKDHPDANVDTFLISPFIKQ